MFVAYGALRILCHIFFVVVDSFSFCFAAYLFPHPMSVGSIFESRRTVTLSLKDDFGMRTYHKQLLVVACLFIICKTFSGFSSSFFFLTNRWPSFEMCNIPSATCRQDTFKFYQLLKIITLQVFGFLDNISTGLICRKKKVISVEEWFCIFAPLNISLITYKSH